MRLENRLQSDTRIHRRNMNAKRRKKLLNVDHFMEPELHGFYDEKMFTLWCNSFRAVCGDERNGKTLFNEIAVRIRWHVMVDAKLIQSSLEIFFMPCSNSVKVNKYAESSSQLNL